MPYTVYCSSVRPGLAEWARRVNAGELIERPAPMRSRFGVSFQGVIPGTTDTSVDLVLVVETGEIAYRLCADLREACADRRGRGEWYRLSEDDILHLSRHAVLAPEVLSRVIRAARQEKRRGGPKAGRGRGKLELTKRQLAELAAWKAADPRPTYRDLAARLRVSLGMAHKLVKRGD